MVRLTLKSIFARKLRFALTTSAIVIGVAFSVASFVLTDSLTDTFDRIAADIEEGVDLTVRSRLEFGDQQLRAPVDASLIEAVAEADGVEAVAPRLFALSVVPFRADGDPVTTPGAPLFGLNFTPDAGRLNQLILVDGRPPAGPEEFGLDVTTARREGFVVGERYQVSGPAGTRTFELVATIAFATPDNQTAGAVLTVFDTPTAQELFGRGDRFDEIAVAVSPGADPEAVAAELERRLPDGHEVVGQQVKIQEQQDEFRTIINIFGNVLLAFAIVMVVVAAFIINNTFTIVLGQRIRELGLLRALGATGNQVTRSVIGEAAMLGVVSAAVGLGAGVGMAVGLRGLLGALGFELPEGPLIVAPRTLVAAAVVGIGVTVAVSLAPARRARRVPPMAAMRDDVILGGPGLRRRLVTGGAVLASGAVLMAWGLFGSLPTARLLGAISVGALGIFVGVNLLSPTVARPVASALGRPLRAAYNVAGRLAQENAARSPRRTASTASALMIGLALVSMASVIGASLTDSFIRTLDRSVRADYIIQPASATGGGFTAEVAERVGGLPGVEAAVPYRGAANSMRIDGSTKSVAGTRLALLPTQIDMEVVDGAIEGAPPNALLVAEDAAGSAALAAGDVVTATFADGTTVELVVAAVYSQASLLGNWIIDLGLFEERFPSLTDDFLVSVTQLPGADPAEVRWAIDEATRTYPVKVEDRDEFKASTRAQVNSLLAVIQVFLLIALLIAGLGIANTLALSIFERTREIGLLRAVGMTRRQLKRMIRGEALVVSLFGGLLGVGLGVLFGIAGTTAIPDTIIDTLTVPYPLLAVYLVAAMVIGLLASLAPARRASRLDVLRAIAHE